MSTAQNATRDEDDLSVSQWSSTDDDTVEPMHLWLALLESVNTEIAFLIAPEGHSEAEKTTHLASFKDAAQEVIDSPDTYWAVLHQHQYPALAMTRHSQHTCMIYTSSKIACLPSLHSLTQRSQPFDIQFQLRPAWDWMKQKWIWLAMSKSPLLCTLWGPDLYGPRVIDSQIWAIVPFPSYCLKLKMSVRGWFRHPWLWYALASNWVAIIIAA